MTKSIGVIGLGVVGGQVFNWFKRKKINVCGYDKFKKIGTPEEIKQAEIIFLCLPTPFKYKIGSDISALEENIKLFKSPKIFVIKSTISPGTTNFLQKKYKFHKFLFNPEFLRQKTSREDFIRPNLQIIGHTLKSKKTAKEVLKLLPRAKIERIIKAAEAEVIKCAINSFLAVKVVFANQIYDLCQKLGLNYDTVKEILQNEPRLGKSHFEIFHDGFRGFGGKCLPKDLKALVSAAKKNEIKLDLLEKVDEYNEKLINKQNLTEIYKKYWLNNKDN